MFIEFFFLNCYTVTLLLMTCPSLTNKSVTNDQITIAWSTLTKPVVYTNKNWK